jgi:hypothetical protein
MARRWRIAGKVHHFFNRAPNARRVRLAQLIVRSSSAFFANAAQP